MSDSKDYLGVPANVLAAADKAIKAGFNLQTPPTAEKKRDRSSGLTRFSELVVIEGATREEKTGKLGQSRIQYVLKVKVKPFGEENVNVGRKVTEFILVNHGWIHGNEEFLGSQDPDKETTMNNMSLTKINSLLVSGGFDMKQGFSADMIMKLFPVKDSGDKSGLLGKQFTFVFKDKLMDDESHKQEVAAIFPAPEA